MRVKVISGQSSDDLEDKVNEWICKTEDGSNAVRIHQFTLTVDGELLYFTAAFDVWNAGYIPR